MIRNSMLILDRILHHRPNQLNKATKGQLQFVGVRNDVNY